MCIDSGVMFKFKFDNNEKIKKIHASWFSERRQTQLYQQNILLYLQNMYLQLHCTEYKMNQLPYTLLQKKAGSLILSILYIIITYFRCSEFFKLMKSTWLVGIAIIYQATGLEINTRCELCMY